MQVPRRTPRSLSLRSLGVARVMRKIASIEQPKDNTKRVMLFDSGEGVYLFLYGYTGNLVAKSGPKRGTALRGKPVGAACGRVWGGLGGLGIPPLRAGLRGAPAPLRRATV